MQVIARSLKASVSPWKSSRTDRPSFSLAILTTSGTEKPDRASSTRTGTEKRDEEEKSCFGVCSSVVIERFSRFLKEFLDFLFKKSSFIHLVSAIS